MNAAPSGEIVPEEFRWPPAGDMPFLDAPGDFENANIADGAMPGSC